MKMQPYIVFVLVLFILGSVSEGNDKTEVTMDNAVRIATTFLAEKGDYKSHKYDIEVLKVKKGVEKGPIRMVSLMRYFPFDELRKVFEGDFFIVYFYQKGGMEDPHTLDGDFVVLIDLYLGKVIKSSRSE